MSEEKTTYSYLFQGIKGKEPVLSISFVIQGTLIHVNDLDESIFLCVSSDFSNYLLVSGRIFTWQR